MSSRVRQHPDGGYDSHRYFDLAPVLDLPNGGNEIDVEGLDWDDGLLWMVGSHTSTRKGVDTSRSTKKNLKKLAKVERRLNRFVIGCVPVVDGTVCDRPSPRRLPISKKGNALTKALRRDPHLGPFVNVPEGRHRAKDLQLASKEN